MQSKTKRRWILAVVIAAIVLPVLVARIMAVSKQRNEDEVWRYARLAIRQVSIDDTIDGELGLFNDFVQGRIEEGKDGSYMVSGTAVLKGSTRHGKEFAWKYGWRCIMQKDYGQWYLVDYELDRYR